MAYDKPNYTQTPNAFFDDHLPKIKSLAELKVTLIVLRNTLGWHIESVDLTLTELQERTGMTRHSVIEGTKLATERGTIKRVKKGRSFTYEANVLSVQNLHLSKKPVSAESTPPSVKNLHSSGADSLLVKERKEKKQDKPRRKEPLPEPSFTSKLLLKAWGRFVMVQNEKNRTLTPTQVTGLYEQIDVIGEQSAIAALNEAANAGWPAIFPKQNGFNGNGNGNPDLQSRHMQPKMTQAQIDERRELDEEYAENIRRSRAERA